MGAHKLGFGHPRTMFGIDLRILRLVVDAVDVAEMVLATVEAEEAIMIREVPTLKAKDEPPSFVVELSK